MSAKTKKRTYNIKNRDSHIVDMLHALSVKKTSKVQTVSDYLISYSRENGGDLHTDPVRLRSAITSAQRLVRSAREEITAVTSDGRTIVIQTAREAGPYNSLLGKKLYPSHKNVIRTGDWYGDVGGIDNKEQIPTGYDIPQVKKLIDQAEALGYREENEEYFRMVIRATLKDREKLVASKTQEFDNISIANAKIEEQELVISSQNVEIDQMKKLTTALQQAVALLNNQSGVLTSVNPDLPKMLEMA